MDNIKVGLLPLDPRTNNYGCQLQQYALFRVINEMNGYECEIIDEKYNGNNSLFSVHYSWKNITIDWVLSKLKGKNSSVKISAEKREALLRRNKKYEEFRDKHVNLSPKCTIETISDIAKKYDCLVCGSDQIWNPSFASPNYFLDFANKNQTSVIYAASIGREKFSKREQKVFKPYMQNCDFISVREKNAVDLVKDIVPEKDIKLVLDPALLLKGDEWNTILSKDLIEDEKYVLVHMMGQNSEAIKAAESFAENQNLKLISMINDVEETRFEAGPEEFLSFIRDAEYVITDSFHATVFSLLFHKQFYCFGRNMAGHSMNSRIGTLLGYCKLEKRLGTSDDMNTFLTETIDYNKVDILLDNEREKSLEYLRAGIAFRK